MGRSWASAIGRARLLTISAAAALVLAGVALHGSGSTGGATFRDLAYGPAPTHHVKLVGVVVSEIRTQGGGADYSIRRGKKKVGTWALGAPACVGFAGHGYCTLSGRGTMKIGRLKGKVDISMKCTSHPTGSIDSTTSGKAGEVLSFGKCPSEAKGSKFKFTLGY